MLIVVEIQAKGIEIGAPWFESRSEIALREVDSAEGPAPSHPLLRIRRRPPGWRCPSLTP